jgi:hypothetical protein
VTGNLRYVGESKVASDVAVFNKDPLRMATTQTPLVKALVAGEQIA